MEFVFDSSSDKVSRPSSRIPSALIQWHVVISWPQELLSPILSDIRRDLAHGVPIRFPVARGQVLECFAVALLVLLQDNLAIGLLYHLWPVFFLLVGALKCLTGGPRLRRRHLQPLPFLYVFVVCNIDALVVPGLCAFTAVCSSPGGHAE